MYGKFWMIKTDLHALHQTLVLVLASWAIVCLVWYQTSTDLSGPRANRSTASVPPCDVIGSEQRARSRVEVCACACVRVTRKGTPDVT